MTRGQGSPIRGKRKGTRGICGFVDGPSSDEQGIISLLLALLEHTPSLASADVPENQPRRAADGREATAIRREGDRSYGIATVLENVSDLPRSIVPKCNPAVQATGGQQGAIRAKRDGRDTVRVPV